MLFLDQNFMLYPMLHLVLVLILCTRDLIKQFSEIGLTFRLHFQHIELNSQENHKSKQPTNSPPKPGLYTRL